MLTFSGESALDEVYAKMDHEVFQQALSEVAEIIRREGPVSVARIDDICLSHAGNDIVRGMRLSIRMRDVLKSINRGTRFCLQQ